MSSSRTTYRRVTYRDSVHWGNHLLDFEPTISCVLLLRRPDNTGGFARCF